MLVFRHSAGCRDWSVVGARESAEIAPPLSSASFTDSGDHDKTEQHQQHPKLSVLRKFTYLTK